MGCLGAAGAWWLSGGGDVSHVQLAAAMAGGLACQGFLWFEGSLAARAGMALSLPALSFAGGCLSAWSAGKLAMVDGLTAGEASAVTAVLLFVVPTVSMVTFEVVAELALVARKGLAGAGEAWLESREPWGRVGDAEVSELESSDLERALPKAGEGGGGKPSI